MTQSTDKLMINVKLKPTTIFLATTKNLCSYEKCTGTFFIDNYNMTTLYEQHIDVQHLDVQQLDVQHVDAQ